MPSSPHTALTSHPTRSIAEEIADALQLNKGLLTIDLSANNIGPKAGNKLSDAMAANSTATSLILDHNRLGNQGVAALCTGLEKNTTLSRWCKRARCSCDLDSHRSASDLIVAMLHNYLTAHCLTMNIKFYRANVLM
jgi:hypothetical protein